MLEGAAGIGAAVEPGRRDRRDEGGDRAVAGGQPAAASDPIATTLTAVDGGTRVVVRDGRDAVVHDGTLLAGEVQQLEVRPPITVTADDGSVVSISLDGRDLGLVGAAEGSTTRTYRRPSR